jgi:sec-independent protein translocase protein TatB
MMNRMSFSETIFLFLLALIIFGPKKLPEIARQVGKYMNEFKRASNEFKAQIEQEISHLDVENRQTILPPSPHPSGATSRSLNAAPAETAAAEGPAAEASTKAVPATEVSVNQIPPTPATSDATSDDEPLFASGTGASSSSASSGATDAVSPEATSPVSQGSHV